jgi:hypothetical protein
MNPRYIIFLRRLLPFSKWSVEYRILILFLTSFRREHFIFAGLICLYKLTGKLNTYQVCLVLLTYLLTDIVLIQFRRRVSHQNSRWKM